MAVAVQAAQVRHRITSVRTAFWLGWQMDSNWTDPFLFAVYSIIKPLSGALILLFIYRVAAGPAIGSAFFSNMYVGNAFFALVGQMLLGMSWVIVEDREFFRMIRYVYASSSPYHLYLLGRGLSKLAISAVSVLILMGFGRTVLGLPVSLHSVNWPMLSSTVLLGVLCAAGLGYAIASLQFFMARHGGAASEAVAGVLYLLCGVLYPVSTLPPWAQRVSRLIPLTYWLEALRRSVLGSETAAAFTGAYAGRDLSLMALLTLGSVASLAIGLLVFKAGQAAATRRGIIDTAQDY
ncbi:MAG: ABC transporter permease [Clostridia bacterium]|nr:ABC transporter permease [Clostridia bacterium]